MILRSSKALKHSSEHSPVASTDCEDIISKLPDVLLIHILSLLPDADACRTSVLSKRWKDLWVFLPYLHVVIPNNSTIEQANEYYDLVDKTLAVRDDMPIRRFFLYCSSECDYKRVHDWLRIVVLRKVQILELTCPRDKHRVRFSWDLFKTCNSLVELTLEGDLELDVAKDNILFPCLKKLNLVSVIYSGDESFVNLITSCHVLEELFLKKRDCTDNLKKIKVSSTSLKRLRICFTMDYANDCEVVIDAPKLEYLYLLSNRMSINYSLTKPPPLVEAYVSTSYYSSIAELFTSISCAKMMTLTYWTVSAISSMNLDMPIFPNLVKLIIHIERWDFLLKLLSNMPNLEHITFLDGFPDRKQSYYCGKAESVVLPPDCLPFKMKEITILNYDTITDGELSYIEHFLKHSVNLEKLRINAHNICSKRAEQILTFYHASNLCQIEFMWGTKRRRRPRRYKPCGPRKLD
ncbi:F-box/RNI-like/FBD-like domains-containing protein [Artemisia annua]|uniref:F-box/RNI-like/FBD-like domains-containing protein n=1 Tax=Artemisia annua TaxID=35608 RepID=A0A2U1PBU9_ARTAN|nr:F-box/RNI-like/FBD-like domains-containing protein [Artemisia annua]